MHSTRHLLGWAIAALTCASAWAGCPIDPDTGGLRECPDLDGIVTVDLRHDVPDPGDGMLDASEIQCAIDCLDGDPLPDHSIRPDGALPIVHGGVVHFVPGLKYRIPKPIDLPLAATGAVVLEGNGDVQPRLVADGARSGIRRRWV